MDEHLYDLQKFLNRLANDLDASNNEALSMTNRATRIQDSYFYRKEAERENPDSLHRAPKKRPPRYDLRRSKKPKKTYPPIKTKKDVQELDLDSLEKKSEQVLDYISTGVENLDFGKVVEDLKSAAFSSSRPIISPPDWLDIQHPKTLKAWNRTTSYLKSKGRLYIGSKINYKEAFYILNNAQFPWEERIASDKAVFNVLESLDNFAIPCPSFVDLKNADHKLSWEAALNSLSRRGLLLVQDGRKNSSRLVPNYVLLTQVFNKHLNSLMQSKTSSNLIPTNLDDFLLVKEALRKEEG